MDTMIIAKCGLVCSDCNAYKATIKNDDDLRKQTAREWSAMFKTDIDWKTVNCEGCQESDKEKVFSYCRVCAIRQCALEKGYATCAECADFGCEKVRAIWEHDGGAQKRLEQLRG
jgi:hypothetical protein